MEYEAVETVDRKNREGQTGDPVDRRIADFGDVDYQ